MKEGKHERRGKGKEKVMEGNEGGKVRGKGKRGNEGL